MDHRTILVHNAITLWIKRPAPWSPWERSRKFLLATFIVVDFSPTPQRHNLTPFFRSPCPQGRNVIVFGEMIRCRRLVAQVRGGSDSMSVVTFALSSALPFPFCVAPRIACRKAETERDGRGERRTFDPPLNAHAEAEQETNEIGRNSTYSTTD